ncbi:MAG: FAD-dependent oxidoreductase [Candidatus Aminicenantales bacterium]
MQNLDSRDLLRKFKDHARAFGAEIVSEDAIDFNFWKAEAKEIGGEKSVERIRIATEGGEEDIPVMGCFIFRESLASPLFAKAGLKLDHRQCLAVDRFQRTNLEGVFAAGDINCGGMQVVTAAGEGAAAAMQAIVYLRKTG